MSEAPRTPRNAAIPFEMDGFSIDALENVIRHRADFFSNAPDKPHAQQNDLNWEAMMSASLHFSLRMAKILATGTNEGPFAEAFKELRNAQIAWLESEPSRLRDQAAKEALKKRGVLETHLTIEHGASEDALSKIQDLLHTKSKTDPDWWGVEFAISRGDGTIFPEHYCDDEFEDFGRLLKEIKSIIAEIPAV